MNLSNACKGNLITTKQTYIKKVESTFLYNVTINSLKGNPIYLSKYKGKKILFVNVALKCGFTPQLIQLQELHERYGNQLIVIGVPCNQFGNQEPNTPAEIESFCKTYYNVSFLMTEKIEVKGLNIHPLYKWLTTKALNGKQNSIIKWNFQKYLVDENGGFLDYFYSVTKPLNPRITTYLK